MITEIYIEALLVNKDLADQVWEKWDAGLINDDCVRIAWWLVVNHATGIVDNNIGTAKPTSPP